MIKLFVPCNNAEILQVSLMPFGTELLLLLLIPHYENSEYQFFFVFFFFFFFFFFFSSFFLFSVFSFFFFFFFLVFLSFLIFFLYFLFLFLSETMSCSYACHPFKSFQLKNGDKNFPFLDVCHISECLPPSPYRAAKSNTSN